MNTKRALIQHGWLWLAVSAVFLAGCAQNGGLLSSTQTEEWKKQQLAISRQLDEYRTKAATLDRDNQQLQTLLAEANQRTKTAQEQLELLRQQLKDTTEQLAQAKKAAEESQRQVQTLTASLHRQGSVAIDPNNSLLDTLPMVNVGGAEVIRDGDVIRIIVPADSLFVPGTMTLQSGATEIISAIAREILRLYPDQMVGIEGFTDNGPIAGNLWKNHMELSLSWAAAVHHVLVTQTRLSSDQLFVVGHGAAHPRASNASESGRRTNRRVEFVLYPEQRPR
ncbi:OmpA family protein [Thermostilla marina]